MVPPRPRPSPKQRRRFRLANQRQGTSHPLSNHWQRRRQLLPDPATSQLKVRQLRPPNDAHPRQFQMARRHNSPGKYGRPRSQTGINATRPGHRHRIRPHPRSQDPSSQRRQRLCPHPHAYVYAHRVYQNLLQGGTSKPHRRRRPERS